MNVENKRTKVKKTKITNRNEMMQIRTKEKRTYRNLTEELRHHKNKAINRVKILRQLERLKGEKDQRIKGTNKIKEKEAE